MFCSPYKTMKTFANNEEQIRNIEVPIFNTLLYPKPEMKKFEVRKSSENEFLKFQSSEPMVKRRLQKNEFLVHMDKEQFGFLNSENSKLDSLLPTNSIIKTFDGTTNNDHPNRQGRKRKFEEESVDASEAVDDLPSLLKKFRGLADSVQQSDPSLMNQEKIKEYLGRIDGYVRSLNSIVNAKTGV